METKSTDLHVKIEKMDGNELIIRHGEALPLEEPGHTKVVGDIDCPGIFVKTRSPKKETTMAVVRRRAAEIELLVNEQYAVTGSGYQIIGRLNVNPDLAAFDINGAKMYNREQMVKLLRFNKRFFADKEAFNNLLEQTMTFSAKVNTEISAANDLKGNQSASVNKTTKLADDFVFSFSLLMPLHEGQKPKKFMVDIRCDVTEGSIRFWFESPELMEIAQTEREEVLVNEAQVLEETGMPVFWA